MMASGNRKPPRMQSQMDTKHSFYMPDGSGRDYYISLQQSKGRYDPLCVTTRGDTSTKRDINIITGQPTLNTIDANIRDLIQQPLQPVPSGNPLIDTIRTALAARGSSSSFRSLVRVLRIMDDNGNRSLSREEFTSGLKDFGVRLRKDQLDECARLFDRNGDGSISITEFVRTIREPMNERRRRLVLQAFCLLDVVTNGVVTFDELKVLYDVSRHPEVLTGSKTAQQIFTEFSQAWDKNGDHEITREEFLDYYEDISSAIDNDDYFELMIRNAWHMSGGEGVCENTTCRRVLVIHTDGRQTVEEVKNDLGLTANDTDGIRRKLEEQGITDIQDIVLTSLVDGLKNKLQAQAKPKAVKPPVVQRQSRTDFANDRAIPIFQARAAPNPWKTTNQRMFEVKPTEPSPIDIGVISGYQGHLPGKHTLRTFA